MKRILSPAFPLFILIALLFSFSGCTEEDDIIDPINDAREAYIDEWLCQETQKSTNNTYTVTIVADPSNSAQVLIKNYMQLGVELSAYAIVTEQSISVPSQKIEGDESWTVNAFGTFTDNNTITWDYYNANQLQLKAVFTRKN